MNTPIHAVVFDIVVNVFGVCREVANFGKFVFLYEIKGLVHEFEE